MFEKPTFGSSLHRGHEPRPNRACVVECGGRDTAFGRGFNYLPPSNQHPHRQHQPIASPSPVSRRSGAKADGEDLSRLENGERNWAKPKAVRPGERKRASQRRDSSERGERLLFCCSFVGELLIAGARGSHIALFPLRSRPLKSPLITPSLPMLLLAHFHNFSTFPSAKIKSQKLIIPQCSRASDANPLKPVLKVNCGNRAQKNSRNFFSHFHRKSLANQAKILQKTMRNNAKKPRFLTRFCHHFALNFQFSTHPTLSFSLVAPWQMALPSQVPKLALSSGRFWVILML
jgi:hypothetical protein